MAVVRPFRGIRYNPQRAGELGLNVCPPFDVITPTMQRDLYERSEFNIVRLELARRGLAEDPYESAAEAQREWMECGALQQDDAPSMYVTEETFTYQGQQNVRRGFIAAVRLEEYDRSVVQPHESTRADWVEDRVRLMGAAQSNYSPLLVLHRDDLRSSVGGILRAVTGGAPTVDIHPPDMPALRMWRVTDPGTLDLLSDALADSPLFIADGHHRYEAALRYHGLVRSGREVAPEESINYRMMLLVSVTEPGLITRGYHRAVSGATPEELTMLRGVIAELFELKPWDPPAADDVQTLAERFCDALGVRDTGEMVIGLYGFEPGRFHIARMKSPAVAPNALEDSEYYRLHEDVLMRAFSAERQDEAVDLLHDLPRLLSSVREGVAQMALVMRPVPMTEFLDIVTRGWRLPPKATNFFPKPSAGAVIQTVEGEL